MKKIILISAATMLAYATWQVCGFGNCQKANAQTFSTYETVKGEPKTVTLRVTGMTCSGCSNHISGALSKTEGIISQEVKFPGDVAIVKYDPDKITENDIITTIEKAGYKAEVKKDELEKEESKSDTKSNKKCCANNKKSCSEKK